MAEIKLQAPFGEVHGAIEKHGIISRQKKYRDNRGRVIFSGKQEIYAVRRPRDFRKDPPKGEELKNHNRWKETCLRTAEIINIGQPKRLDVKSRICNYYTPEEALALYNDYKARFEKQLPNVRGCHPDPFAPIDPKNNRHKRYIQLPPFIRALIYQELKAQIG